jgi:DNA-binding MarR family transcriptional regulator
MRTLSDVMSRTWARDVTLLLGLLSWRKKEKDQGPRENGDVARLFFDSFSQRVGTVEGGLKTMSNEMEKLKISIDRSQLSDLVLLERLQKAEALVRESLNLTKQAIEASNEAKETPTTNNERHVVASSQSTVPSSIAAEEAAISRRILAPAGELGSLSSITTPTELQVLAMLANEGPKSAPEIGRVVGRSREHTARLMKKLYEEGYIRRDQTRIPFRYSVVERVKQSFVKQETRDAEKEAISVPQT